MIQPDTIFQRTQAGRDEIYQKSHGLTQSERLVLIMVDGATNYSGIRTKLPVLKDERFDRALNSLQKKELVLEVFLPLAAPPVDDVESTVIDRFLQQDPLDPVTIISLDPDEDFGVLAESMSSPSCTQPGIATAPQSLAAHETSTRAEWVTPSALDVALAEIDAFASERRSAIPESRPAAAIPKFTYEATERRHGVDRRQNGARGDLLAGLHFHWGFMLIGIGSAFILGFMLGRLGA